MTSDPLSEARFARRTAWFIYGCWTLMVVLGIVWIARYTANNPLIDEWEFVPALLDEEPTLPWLWKQHNEHRFLVPRMVYYPLFKLTHDFRTGCYVSLFGLALLALAMVRLARQLRGRLHWADAFFPLSLLNWGHFENFRMGYQICFMLITLFAGLILRSIVLTSREHLFRRGLQVGLLLIPLMGCGAGGLAFGPPLAIWFLAIAGWLAFGFSPPVSTSVERRSARVARAIVLLALAASVPTFIALYYEGYVPPEFHPPSAGVFASLRVAIQSLTMAFGVAASGIWPLSGFIVVVLGFECVLRLLRVVVGQPEERPRALGLLLYLGAIVAMAFGIGWGRSGFGEDANMGLASRYGWLMWPGSAAVYLMWMLYGGALLSRWVPIALCVAVLGFLPFNLATGIVEGERYRALTRAWEGSVREETADEELIGRYCEDAAPHVRERIRVALRLMRKNTVSYYFPLREPIPDAAPRRQNLRPRVSTPFPDEVAR